MYGFLLRHTTCMRYHMDNTRRRSHKAIVQSLMGKVDMREYMWSNLNGSTIIVAGAQVVEHI